MSINASIYLFLQRFIGSRADRSWREINTAATMSTEAYRTDMETRLSQTLAEAIQSIPFYSSRASRLDAKDLSTFPILDKTTLVESFLTLMSPRVHREFIGEKPRGYGWLEVRSGGTTGVPVAVIHGRDFRDHDRALRMFQMSLCGFPFGTPYWRLWGSMNDITKMKDSCSHRIMSWLARERLLNAFHMETADMDRYIALIGKGHIRFMIAYVDAAVQLAHHIKEKGSPRPELTSIMACAGTVTDEARELLRDAFGARVYNKYGSRDAGEIACECSHGGLHILPGVFVEVVDKHGKACKPGVSGRLLITSLHNRDFPIIRYEIGDVGTLSDRWCTCGLPFPLLERLEGRSVEFLLSTTGGYISPVYIRHLVGVVHPPPGLKRYQVEQIDATQFILRLERDTGAAPWIDGEASLLRQDLLRVLGPDASLTIEDVPAIAESTSGKFLYVINRYREQIPNHQETRVDFSIVTPSFNASVALRRAIGSVRGQGNILCEHIVQDGGSTDGTTDWLATQSDLNWRSESDSGMYDAINRGWSRANGQYLSWLNCDEQYLPGTLKLVREFFIAHPECDVVVGNKIVVNEEGDPIAARRDIPLRAWLLKNTFNYAPSCATFFRRRLWDSGLLRMDTRYRFSADKDLMLRLLNAGVKVGRINTYLSLFTLGDKNLSVRKDAQMEARAVALAHGGSPHKIVRSTARIIRWTERWYRGHYHKANLEYVFAVNEVPKYRNVAQADVGFKMKWNYKL